MKSPPNIKGRGHEHLLRRGELYGEFYCIETRGLYAQRLEESLPSNGVSSCAIEVGLLVWQNNELAYLTLAHFIGYCNTNRHRLYFLHFH